MPHIPMLYQLSYQEFTLMYSLFREETQDLIDNLDRRVPTHHQVDPRVIEVSKYYREYYLNWLAAVDVNNQSIQ
jgi:hypothetical protein